MGLGLSLVGVFPGLSGVLAGFGGVLVGFTSVYFCDFCDFGREISGFCLSEYLNEPIVVLEMAL